MSDQILTALNSSTIAGYEYTGTTLLVGFRSGNNNGALYRYDNVPPDIVASFVAADSHGSFFASNIRKSFAFKKLDAQFIVIDKPSPKSFKKTTQLTLNEVATRYPFLLAF